MPIICSGNLEKNLRSGGLAGSTGDWKGADFLNSIQDIWNMVLDGCGGSDREAWRMLSEAAHEATRTDDPSGRGVKMNDHTHLKYIAAKQAEMAERQKEMDAKLDAVVSALEGFVPAVEDEGAGE